MRRVWLRAGPGLHFVEEETGIGERVCEGPSVQVAVWGRAGRPPPPPAVCLQSVPSLSQAGGGGVRGSGVKTSGLLAGRPVWCSRGGNPEEVSRGRAGSKEISTRVLHRPAGPFRSCPCGRMSQERLAVTTNSPPSSGLSTISLRALITQRLAGAPGGVPTRAAHLQE